MTFCIVVASRPPHSLGQLMAAQRPSLRRRCHAWRRAMVRVGEVGVLGADLALVDEVTEVGVEPLR